MKEESCLSEWDGLRKDISPPTDTEYAVQKLEMSRDV